MKKKLVKRAVALAVSFVLMLALFAPVMVSANTPVFSIPSFTGLTLADAGQFVDGTGIQRMNWNDFVGSVIAIDGAVMNVTGGAAAKGFQFSPHHASNQMFQGVTGTTYRLVMDASATSAAGIINLVPDNHPAGVAQRNVPLPAERTTFTITWTQVDHEHNNLQISSDVDFTVYSIVISEVSDDVDPELAALIELVEDLGFDPDNLDVPAFLQAVDFVTLVGVLYENGVLTVDNPDETQLASAIEDLVVALWEDGRVAYNEENDTNITLEEFLDILQGIGGGGGIDLSVPWTVVINEALADALMNEAAPGLALAGLETGCVSVRYENEALILYGRANTDHPGWQGIDIMLDEFDLSPTGTYRLTVNGQGTGQQLMLEWPLDASPWDTGRVTGANGTVSMTFSGDQAQTASMTAPGQSEGGWRIRANSRTSAAVNVGDVTITGITLERVED